MTAGPEPTIRDFHRLSAVPKRVVYWICKSTDPSISHKIELAWPGPKPAEWTTLLEPDEEEQFDPRFTTLSEPDEDGRVTVRERNATPAALTVDGKAHVGIRADEIMELVDRGFVVKHGEQWVPHPVLTWAGWWLALEVENALRR